MMNPPGTVRVLGGATTDDTRIEVSDGFEWLPVRGVTRVEWVADAVLQIPRLVLHLEPMVVGGFVSLSDADCYALALAGISRREVELAGAAVERRHAARRFTEIWGPLLRSLATWGRPDRGRGGIRPRA